MYKMVCSRGKSQLKKETLVLLQKENVETLKHVSLNIRKILQ